MEKIISIGGKEVGMKATASTISRYRKKFNRDLLTEFRKLYANYEQGTEFSTEDLGCFERLAYIMAWQYDNTIPSSPDDWLDQFEIFDVYIVLPEIIELWGTNNIELEKPKKKVEGQSEN